MDNVLKISVKNSELSIPKDKRPFLTYPAEGLAACSLEELEDGVNFIFDIVNLIPSREVLSKSKEQQLRFLINCSDLEKLCAEYDFSLSADNLLADINLRPQVLLRDTVKSNAGNTAKDNNQTFLTKYKALIGSFLLSKYKYEDFMKGGESLFEKNKLLLEISKINNAAEIKKYLMQEYFEIIRDVQQNHTLTPKRNALIFRVLIPSLAVLLLAASFFAAMAYLNQIPFRDSIITANEAYIAGSPMEVQRALAGYSVEQLSHETRLILSRSYVATEPLNDVQRSNILMGLALITDGSIFDYWIHLGRLEFYDAIDIALRFGDSELLLFAYIRQEAFVRADPNIPGSEKVVQLSYLEGRIAALQRERGDAEGLMLNSSNLQTEDPNNEDQDQAYSDFDLIENDYEFNVEDEESEGIEINLP